MYLSNLPSRPHALAWGCRRRMSLKAKIKLVIYLKLCYNNSVFGIGCELLHWYIA